MTDVPLHTKSLFQFLDGKYLSCDMEWLKLLAGRIPSDYLVPDVNADLMARLLANITRVYNETDSKDMRAKRSMLVVGAAKTGKTRLLQVLHDLAKEWVSSMAKEHRLICVLASGSDLIHKDVYDRMWNAYCEIVDGTPQQQQQQPRERPTDFARFVKQLEKEKIFGLVLVDDVDELYPLARASSTTKRSEGCFFQLTRANESEDAIEEATLPERRVVATKCRNQFYNMSTRPGMMAIMTTRYCAMERLISHGYHPYFHASYHGIRSTKIEHRTLLTLRDADSIKDLFLVARGATLTQSEVDDLYRTYGGSIGNLLFKVEDKVHVAHCANVLKTLFSPTFLAHLDSERMYAAKLKDTQQHEQLIKMEDNICKSAFHREQHFPWGNAGIWFSCLSAAVDFKHRGFKKREEVFNKIDELCDLGLLEQDPSWTNRSFYLLHPQMAIRHEMDDTTIEQRQQ